MEYKTSKEIKEELNFQDNYEAVSLIKNLEKEKKILKTQLTKLRIKCALADVSGSWLDHHILNEDSEIDGIIIKHHQSPETYGGVAIKTHVGNFAIVKEDQEKAVKNKGETVRVKPHKDYYGTVMILQYQ